MQILARGAGTDAPHPLLASGWRTISNAQAEVARTVRESLAALSDMRARMTAAERECEEARTLLKVSEQRRLALLESRAAQEAPASDGHKPASLVLPPALSSAHVAPDARLYATREDLLRALAIPRHGIVAELGVAMGDFSARIMETLAPAQFVAFDTFEMHQTPSHWGTASSVLFDNLTHLEFYKRRFAEAGDRVRIERGDSRSTLPQYEDEFFDFIYVDAGHTYDHVKHDAVTALRKLKPGGILAFNDYIMYDLYLRVDYGVVQAVNELVVEHDLQVIGFGLQQVMFCDIAVRKRA
jgi:hypothetical protein